MKKIIIVVAVFTFLYLGCFAQKNPIITEIYTADPSAHVWKGRLYIYASHDVDPPRGCDLMDKYHVFSTKDMKNWKDHGEILNSSQVSWGRPEGGFMWAPDCAYKNGTYYFYFPHPSGTDWNKTWKIGVATSKKPASDFTSQSYILIRMELFRKLFRPNYSLKRWISSNIKMIFPMRNYLQLSELKGNHRRKILRKSYLLAICYIALFSLILPLANAAQKRSFKSSGKFSFDGSISREVLENYLDRSITMGYFLVPGKPEDYEFPYREDDIRMIKNMGVKFIGRAIYL